MNFSRCRFTRVRRVVGSVCYTPAGDTLRPEFANHMTSTTPNEPEHPNGSDAERPESIASASEGSSPTNAMSEPEIADELYCQDCGYNLRGLTSMRCPECGESLDAVRAMEPRLPWANRDTVGRVRAYWRTVFLVTFRTRLLAEELARPVSYRDAQRFRWVTLLHAYAPMVVATASAYLLFTPGSGSTSQRTTAFEQALAGVWPVVVFHLCLLLWLAAVSGVSGYFYHPRDMAIPQQNRAIALSYYTIAPFAYLAVPVMFALLAAWLGETEWLEDTGWLSQRRARAIPTGVIVFAIALLLIELTAWWAVSADFARRVLPRHSIRRLVAALGLPVLWAILGAIILVGVSTLAFVVFVVAASFR